MPHRLRSHRSVQDLGPRPRVQQACPYRRRLRFPLPQSLRRSRQCRHGRQRRPHGKTARLGGRCAPFRIAAGRREACEAPVVSAAGSPLVSFRRVYSARAALLAITGRGRQSIIGPTCLRPPEARGLASPFDPMGPRFGSRSGAPKLTDVSVAMCLPAAIQAMSQGNLPIVSDPSDRISTLPRGPRTEASRPLRS